MKTAYWLLAGVLAVSGSPAMMHASPMASVQAASDSTTAAADVSDGDLVKMTVHEAWVASGRNEDKFFDFVKRVAEMSAQKRGVTVPDDTEAGTRFGNLVKTNARRDPDQLLYAVVDSAVKSTTMPSTSRAKKAAASRK